MQRDLEQLACEMLKSFEGLSAAETQERPATRPSAWNVQEIVEHLVLTWQSNTAQIEERLAKGRPVRTKVNLRMRVAQFGLITLGNFPKGFEAPVMVVPAVNAAPRNGAELGEKVSSTLRKLDDVCVRAEKMFRSRPSVTHFRLGPLSIAQWQKFHLVHARHHVLQIDTIRLENGLRSAGSNAE
jgi:hypothetical protein